MYYQKFSVYRAIALTLSVALLTAAPLLCIHPISAQIKRSQRVAMKHSRERGVVLGARAATTRLATRPRPTMAVGALAHSPQKVDKEQKRDEEKRLNAPGMVKAAGLAGGGPTWNETEVTGARPMPVTPETVQ